MCAHHLSLAESLFVMSGDFAADVCPTYAVVDIKQKKKKVAENVQKADFALYAVVDKTKKKKVSSKRNDDRKDFLNDEVAQAVREEESQLTLSSRQPEKISDVPANKSSSVEDYTKEKHIKWKSAMIISVVCSIIAIITVSLLAVCLGINAGISNNMIAILRAKITLVQSEAAVDSFEVLQNSSFSINDLNTSGDSSLLRLINELSKNSSLIHDSLNERINFVTLGQFKGYPAPSCQAIHKLHPSFRSGYYWVTSSNGSSIRVYCEMTKSCNNFTGGLTRVAVLNGETRPSICTGDFMIYQTIRCVRHSAEPGCSHIIFSLMNMSYSHVCGTVESSWFGHPDGFIGNDRNSNTTINENYVDGISLTYGKEPSRTHIWTFIADHRSCPNNIPNYVGHNNTCIKYDDLCSSTPESCSPSFFRKLEQPVTEDIEMRLCRDQNRDSGSEGIHFGNMEIYVW